MDKQLPGTMMEAVRQFADPEAAHAFFVQIRWPNGVACLCCGSVKVAYMAKRRRWYCNDCKSQFSAKNGTIFEDSPIGFDKWLPAIWLIASNRNGISSCELVRALHVTQKTAWFILHRIREAFAQKSFDGPLASPVEVDETYIGGLTKSMNAKRRKRYGNPGPGGRGKTAVFGIRERDTEQRKGKVRAFIVPFVSGGVLQGAIRKHVMAGAEIHTDGGTWYQGLDQKYIHHVIDHAYEYVRGNVHTNSIESFFSALKRTLKGAYVAPRPQHLQRYVEEQVFRFNAREEKDGPRFGEAVAKTEGKRLTYKRLTNKE